MRYFIEFSYDGTKFHGFQRQKNVKNVQSTLENTLTKVLNEPILIKGSGRTDAGVHALGQTATFDITRTINNNEKRKIIDLLKDEIGIKKFKRVNDEFHARFSAKGKWYRYKISLNNYNGDLNGYYYQPKFKVDILKLKKASKIFLGKHDFHNFVSGKREDNTTYIKQIKVKYKKGILIIDFYGAGFYRYMVRNLVGALLDVGKGKVSEIELKEMLDNSNIDRQLSVAPAEGLYLIKVYY